MFSSLVLVIFTSQLERYEVGSYQTHLGFWNIHSGIFPKNIQAGTHKFHLQLQMGFCLGLGLLYTHYVLRVPFMCRITHLFLPHL